MKKSTRVGRGDAVGQQPKSSSKKAQPVAGRGSDKFILRMPTGMRNRLASLAAEKGRSMNAEVVAALEKHFETDDTVGELWNKVENLENTARDHKEQLRELRRRGD